MKHHPHVSTNKVMAAPEGMRDLVEDMPVTECVHAGYIHQVSFWKPSIAELALLNAGGSVALWIMGRSMPPVTLAVEPAAAASVGVN